MKRTAIAALVLALTAGMAACSSPSPSAKPATSPSPDGGAPKAAEITLWLAGGDTPDELREYLKTKFAEENKGSTLRI